MKWNRVHASIALLALGMFSLAGCYPLVQVSEDRNATFIVSGRLTLNVDGTNGNIKVRGEAGIDEVRVQAVVTAGASTRSEAEELLSKIDLEMFQEGDVVTLRHNEDSLFRGFDWGRSERVSFEVVVPLNADLSLWTSNGRIEAENVQGNVQAHTSNGRIDTHNIQGDLELQTSNGAIRATESEGSFNARTSNGTISYRGRLVGPNHSAHTSNGSIEFKIPLDLDLEIRANVGNGRIRSSLPLSGDDQGQNWSATLNSSTGALLQLSTSNGSIEIDELRE